MSAYSAAKHVQRRPDLGAKQPLPEELLTAITAKIIPQLEAVTDEASQGAAKSIVKQLSFLVRADTPDNQLRLFSEVSMAVKPTVVASPIDAAVPSSVVFAETHKLLISHVAIPIFFNVSTRYAHRAMLNFVRNIVATNASLMAFCTETVAVELDKFIAAAKADIVAAQSDDATTVTDVVGRVTNTFDALNIALLTIPQFNNLFATRCGMLLPIYSTLLSATLDAVIASKPNGDAAEASEEGDGATNTIYGADLDRIRFVVRVVATLTHKFIERISDDLFSGVEERSALMSGSLCDLFVATNTMLCSKLLPKDVINAAGLLVATILTLTKASPTKQAQLAQRAQLQKILHNVCETAAHVLKPVDGDTLTAVVAVATKDDVDEFLKALFFSPNTVAAATANDKLFSVFQGYTPNGCFCFFRGLLSHSIGLAKLATPGSAKGTAPVSDDANSKKRKASAEAVTAAKDQHAAYDLEGLGLLIHAACGGSVIFDVIVPTTLQQVKEASAPDTKFLAVQTVDSIIRHLATAFSAVATEQARLHRVGTILAGSAAGDASISPSKRKAQETSAGAAPSGVDNSTAAAAATALQPFVPSFLESDASLCKVREVCLRTVSIIVDIWDDPTQQVSGPLYDTYSQILALDESLTKCYVTNDTKAAAVLSVEDALRDAVAMNLDRRGRYHALLALLPRTTLATFIKTIGESNEAIAQFSLDMLRASSSSKISAIAGEVFFHLATMVKEQQQQAEKKKDAKGAEEATALWNALIRRPLTACLFPTQNNGTGGDEHISGGSSSGVNSNSTALCFSVITHMLTPLMKKLGATMLQEVLEETLTTTTNNAAAFVPGSVAAIVTEILVRARSIGINIAPFIEQGDSETEAEPDAPRPELVAFVYRSITDGLHCYESNTRSAAFNLAVLSNKISSPVNAVQCQTVVNFVASNMHNGGDTTYRNAVVAIVGKWCKRLKDSSLSIKSRKCVAATTNDAAPKKDSSKKDKKKVATSTSAIDTTNFDTAWSKYIRLINEHLGKLIAVCADSIASRDYCVERRYTALAIWQAVLVNCGEIIPKPVDAAAVLKEDALKSFSSAAVGGPVSKFSPSSKMGATTGGANAIGNNSAMFTAMLEHLYLAPEQWSKLHSADVSDKEKTELKTIIAKAVNKDLTERFLPLSAIAPLTDTLNEGWDRIRLVAVSILNSYGSYHPTLANCLLGNANDDAATLRAKLEEHVRSCTKLFNVPTFRGSDGMIQRLELLLVGDYGVAEPFQLSFACRAGISSDLQVDVGTNTIEGRKTVARKVAQAYLEDTNAYATACKSLYGSGNLGDMFKAIHDNPIYGRLAMCGNFFKVYIQLCAAASDPTAATAVANNDEAVQQGNQRKTNATHQQERKSTVQFSNVSKQDGDDLATTAKGILSACVNVLDICTRLVSGVVDENDNEDGGAGDDFADLAPEVDCRGHIINQDANMTPAEAEAFNRVVVNNSWTGVKASTAVIEQLLSLISLPNEALLPADALEQVGFTLIRTLLRTKHNGVMSRTRSCLNVLCATLLRARDDRLHSLPSAFLQYLLGSEGVKSLEKSRILRRSQGLPHAIVPILEAEDPSIPFTLFPMCLKELLSVANLNNDNAQSSSQEADSSELRSLHRVNALNVLKFILDDSTFASRVTPFTQEAFLIAAHGFRNTHWAVRNSSLMVFSSAVHRIIGSNTSLNDLLTRLPEAMDFVASELEDAVLEALGQKKNADGTAASGAFNIHPALFPLLLMVSLLQPAPAHQPGGALGTKDGADEHQSPAAATGQKIGTSVARCRTTRNLMARSASASAMAALLPLSHLAPTLKELFASIAPSTEGTPYRCTQNVVHGTLLQIRCLYSTYVGSAFHMTSHARKSLTASAAAVPPTLILDLQRVVEQACHSTFVLGAENAVGVVGRSSTVLKELFSLVADVVFNHCRLVIADGNGKSKATTDVVRLVEKALSFALAVQTTVQNTTSATDTKHLLAHEADIPQCIAAIGQVVAAYTFLEGTLVSHNKSVKNARDGNSWGQQGVVSTLATMINNELESESGFANAATMQRSIVVASLQALNEIHADPNASSTSAGGAITSTRNAIALQVTAAIAAPTTFLSHLNESKADTKEATVPMMLTALMNHDGMKHTALAANDAYPTRIGLVDGVATVLQFATLYGKVVTNSPAKVMPIVSEHYAEVVLRKVPSMCNKWCTHSGVKHWAVRFTGQFAATLLAKSADRPTTLLRDLVELLWSHSQSAEPYNARIGCALALDDLFHNVAAICGKNLDASGDAAPAWTKLVATLLVVLLDDQEPVREKACSAAAAFCVAVNGSSTGGNVSSSLSQWAAVEAFAAAGANIIQKTTTTKSILDEAEKAVVDVVAPAQQQLEKGAAGALFEEESENMFIELPVVKSLFNQLRK